MFTDAEALSLAFSISDVPLIVRGGKQRAYPFITSVITSSSRGLRGVRRIPTLLLSSSSLLPPRPLLKSPVLTLGDRRDEVGTPS